MPWLGGWDRDGDTGAGRENDRFAGGGGGGRGALGRRGGLDQARVEADYEMFLRDLEEDPEMRMNVNLYKAGDAAKPRGGKGKAAFAMDVEPQPPQPVAEAVEEDEDEGDIPQIKIEELLDDFDGLAIKEGDAAEEEEL